jgi:2,3-dihydroxybenzoate-AMP ligase
MEKTVNTVRHAIKGVVYPPQEVMNHYLEAGALTRETLVEQLANTFSRYGDRIAVSESGRLVTYRELDAITTRLAGAFLKIGLRPLDSVVFQLSNSKELVYCFLACLKAGLIPICTLQAHRKQEIGYLSNHAKAVAHLIDGDDTKFNYLEFSREIRHQAASLRYTIVLRAQESALQQGEFDLDRLIGACTVEEAKALLGTVERDPFQVVMYQLSGGTSGVPKIIPRFQNEYLYTIRTVIDWHQLDEQMVTYTPNPLMHNAPMACFWGPALLSGGEVAIERTLDLAAIASMMSARKPNWIILAPPILWRLKDQGYFKDLQLQTAKGFTVTNNAAKLRELTKAPVYPIYGMTEGLLCWCCEEDPIEAIDSYVGRPLSPFDEVKILTPGTENELTDGEVGELVTRGPCTLHGYFDAEERNREAFTSDGFYRTGDLLSFEPLHGKRYLKFWGRVKDVIDRGGEKINAEEVELAMAKHPKVGGVAVVPMPDPQYGERACAFVVLAPGATSLTLQEVREHLELIGLAKFKWPERIEVVTHFPLTASSKLSKPALKDLIAQKLQQERSENVG